VNTQNVSETAPLEERTRWFVQEVHPHDAALKKYLRGSFPSVRDVEDLVQESYLRVWQRHLLQPLSSARSFLYRVARNLAVDTLRRTTISPIACVAEIAELNVADGHPDAAAATSAAEETALLLEAIESLPPRCREVLVLRKLYGLPTREIAVQLGISEGTVELHGAKGMRRCADYLRQRNVTGKAGA
jgi:RNA polymerase sigma-70 factor (ECF subfamily)